MYKNILIFILKLTLSHLSFFLLFTVYQTKDDQSINSFDESTGSEKSDDDDYKKKNIKNENENERGRENDRNDNNDNNLKKYNDVDDNSSYNKNNDDAEIKKKEEVIVRKEVVNEEVITEMELQKAFEESTQHGNSEADITYVLSIVRFFLFSLTFCAKFF